MRFAKGVTKALEKGNKDPLNANKAEVPVLSLIPEEGEYDEDDPSKMDDKIHVEQYTRGPWAN